MLGCAARMNPCASGYIKNAEARSIEELFDVFKEFFVFAGGSPVTTAANVLTFFTQEELDEHLIFHTGTHTIGGGQRGYFFGDAVGLLEDGAQGVFTQHSVAHAYGRSVASLHHDAVGHRHGEEARFHTTGNAYVVDADG